MKTMLEFFLTIIFIAIGATISWIAWNDVSYLFDVPEKWRHLSWTTVFLLLWLIRCVTGIMRQPDIKAKDVAK